jgi:hypothetical protein
VSDLVPKPKCLHGNPWDKCSACGTAKPSARLGETVCSHGVPGLNCRQCYPKPTLDEIKERFGHLSTENWLRPSGLPCWDGCGALGHAGGCPNHPKRL